MLSLLLRIWQQIIMAVGKLTGIEKRLAALESGQKRIEEQLRLDGRALDAFAFAVTDILNHIIDLLEPGPAVNLVFITDLEGQITYGAMNMNLRNDQKVKLSIQPVDKKGNPAAVDGAPAWFNGNSDILSLEVAADGFSATVTPLGPIGSAVVSVEADADLGEGVTKLAGGIDINVVSGAAVNIQIVAGTPEDQ